MGRKYIHIDPSWPPGPRLTPPGAAAWLLLLADHERANTVIAGLAGLKRSTMVGCTVGS